MDMCLVFCLARSTLGSQLLEENDNNVDQLICAKAFNQVIKEGEYKGQSVAFWLAKNPRGQAILQANGGHLAQLIRSTVLNHVISEGIYYGKSVADWLTGTAEGHEILLANDNHLARMMDEKLHALLANKSKKVTLPGARLVSTGLFQPRQRRQDSTSPAPTPLLT